MASFNFVTLIKLSCVGVILMCMVVANAPAAEGAVTCGMVVSKVSACLGYLKSPRKPVPAACCNYIKGLTAAATTTPDRQQICKCLTFIAKSNSGINYGPAEGLPTKCGIKFPFKITLSTDCNKVR